MYKCSGSFEIIILEMEKKILDFWKYYYCARWLAVQSWIHSSTKSLWLYSVPYTQEYENIYSFFFVCDLNLNLGTRVVAKRSSSIKQGLHMFKRKLLPHFLKVAANLMRLKNWIELNKFEDLFLWGLTGC